MNTTITIPADARLDWLTAAQIRFTAGCRSAVAPFMAVEGCHASADPTGSLVRMTADYAGGLASATKVADLADPRGTKLRGTNLDRTNVDRTDVVRSKVIDSNVFDSKFSTRLGLRSSSPPV